MSQLNSQIKEAIDTFDMDKARSLLRDALKEADAETYFLASKVALDEDQRKEFLDKAIQLDPFHEKARNALKANGSTSSTAATLVQTTSTPTTNAPSPQLTEDSLPALVAVVGQAVSLYTLPVESSLVAAQLRKETKVYPFERDDYGDWYQVLYPSPLGKKIGWIKASDVQTLFLNEEEMLGIDTELPITKFEGYTRNEVQQLIKDTKKKMPPNPWFNGQGQAKQEVIWGVIALITPIFCYLASALPDNIYRNGVFVAVLILTIVSCVKSWNHSMVRVKTQNAIRQLYQTRLKRWDEIQLAMRSDYEVMRDDQRWNFFMNSALNLGSNLATTAASRYIPDRKEITLKEKRGK